MRNRTRITAPAAVAALALGLLAALGPVGAGTASAADSTGFVRVAHLSPDTAQVDVTLSSVATGAQLFKLSDVGYGVISNYLSTGAGTYLLQMRPAGAAAGSPAVISGTVEVKPGAAMTVAAYGLNSALKIGVYADDLAAPASGQGRVRLIQASTKTDAVTVQASNGVTVASDAKAGQATSYSAVPAGDWSLKANGGSVQGSGQVDVKSGTVNTLLVLDNASGGLSITPVVDSVASAQTPNGGVQTGGGYLAEQAGGVLVVDAPAAPAAAAPGLGDRRGLRVL